MSVGSDVASQSNAKRRVAFISGHVDVPTETFLQHYKADLDKAISANDNFVLSNAGGVDSQALDYLLSRNIPPSSITIYVHTPPTRNQKACECSDAMQWTDDLRAAPETLERYRKRGLVVRVIAGGHAERDAVLTRDCHYDILWVRSDDETKLLYGKKYRPERVSATQRNKDRRQLSGNTA